jgi:hypothetical protein
MQTQTGEIGPGELRLMLESEARMLAAELRSTGAPVVPGAVAGEVLERHQEMTIVRVRVAWLWRHLEQFVADDC